MIVCCFPIVWHGNHGQIFFGVLVLEKESIGFFEDFCDDFVFDPTVRFAAIGNESIDKK